MPLLTVPVEVTDTQVAVRVAIDGAPKEYGLTLPLLGDELGIGQQVVQNAGVQNGLTFQLLAKLVALDGTTLLLVAEVEFDFVGVPTELATLDVLFDLPAVRHVGIGIAVDDVVLDDDFSVATQEALSSFHTAELVDDGFDGSELQRGILHCGSHFDQPFSQLVVGIFLLPTRQKATLYGENCQRTTTVVAIARKPQLFKAF